MASKGQKFKKYELDFKLQVLKEYKEGYSEGYLTRKYLVPIGTIKTWSQISNKYGSLDQAKKGRPIGTKLKDYKERYEILKKFQDFLVTKGQKKK
jgi:transposase